MRGVTTSLIESERHAGKNMRQENNTDKEKYKQKINSWISNKRERGNLTCKENYGTHRIKSLVIFRRSHIKYGSLLALLSRLKQLADWLTDRHIQ